MYEIPCSYFPLQNTYLRRYNNKCANQHKPATSIHRCAASLDSFSIYPKIIEEPDSKSELLFNFA